MIRYIETEKDFNQAIEQIEKCREIAIDLEFDKNHFRYGFNLCLMQVMADGVCYLIDPLSDEIDITKIFPVLENPDITKVAFAFGEDMRLLHFIGAQPRNIFDLSIAASLLNYPPISLSNLLEEVLGFQPARSAQQSNWFARPLKSVQKQYAAEDVLHLFDLRDKLVSMAEEKGVTSWIEEENQVWETGDFEIPEQQEFLKEKDKKGLSEKQWHIFSRLMSYREKLAESKNRPSYKILDKSFLFAIARQPSHVESWSKTRGMHPGIRNHEGGDEATEIVDQAVQEARELGLSDSKPAEKPLNKDKMAAIRRHRKLIQALKRELFNPVKNVIAQDYGENAAAYIINNRLIDAYATDQTDDILPYRKDLIEYTVSSLGMDVYGQIDEIKSRM